MSAPAVPLNFYAQNGDGNILVSWSITATATSYVLQRSTDGVNFTTLVTLSAANPGGGAPWNYYLDAAANVSPAGPVANTKYWYQVQAVNGSGDSGYTTPYSVTATDIGIVSLGYLRAQAQLRCDRFNSNFVSQQEWNSYITEARKQLYNILTQCFGDEYFSSSNYTYTLAGQVQSYPLPSDFYKLTLCEIALNPGDANSWVTLRQFNWNQKNLWNYPNVYTFYGITNIRYRLNGNNIYLVPIPSGGQTLRIWYIPRPSVLINDTDTVDGISGWEEFVIVTAAMTALLKEESPTAAEFKALKDEQTELIRSAAENRNVGEPQQVSDSKMRNFSWTDGDGSWGGSGSDGGY